MVEFMAWVKARRPAQIEEMIQSDSESDTN